MNAEMIINMIGGLACVSSALAVTLWLEIDPEFQNERLRQIIKEKRIDMQSGLGLHAMVAIAATIAWTILGGQPWIITAAVCIAALAGSSIREEGRVDLICSIALMLSPRIKTSEQREQARLKEQRRAIKKDAIRQAKARAKEGGKPAFTPGMAFSAPRRKTMRLQGIDEKEQQEAEEAAD